MAEAPDIPRHLIEEEPPRDEFARRVLYSMLAAGIRLAADEELTLKELLHWTETGYFHSLKKRGRKMREMSDILDVSMRKVANLSGQLKQNFFQPEREYTLPRQIEFVLWSEPLSRSRLGQVMDVDDTELDEALATLVEQGRAVLEQGRSPRYRIASPTRRIVGRTWMGRIDGLNNLMNNVYETVKARFFDEDERAFARTIQFRVRDEDLPRLRELYEQHIWPTLAELDERAAEHDETTPIDLSILWTATNRGTPDG